MRFTFSSRHFPKKKILSFFSFLIIVSFAKAQKIDSVLNVYAENYQSEKVHVHFDKTAYNAGETIWFKSYVLLANAPSDYSKTFYADWYDDKGRLLKHTAMPMLLSSARGQFSIPPNYTGHTVFVKAYTQWMLNFDSSFIFEKSIPVFSKNSKTNSSNNTLAAAIHFFPEGGDLFTGISSRVAFKVEDQHGRPVFARGVLKNSANKILDSFITVHDGMGSFELEPKVNETYYAEWLDQNGVKHSDALPTVKPSGATIEVETIDGKSIVIAKRTATVTDNFKTMYLLATMNQQLVYRSRVNFASKQSATGEIPTATLPSGILRVTMFDADWKPVAERITFINNHDYEFFPSVRAVTKSFDKRKKNILEIEVGDTLLSNMSVSITDADLPTEKSTSIISQLLLSSELKGKINNADYYFSSSADSVANHLDLVMLTNGWRRYKWEDIVAGKFPRFSYSKDSDYLEIKGKVFGSAFERKNAGQSLNVFLQSKDSSKQLMIIPVDADGNFAQKNMLFFDTVKLYYMFNGDKKLTNKAEVVFQNGLLSPTKNNLKQAPSYLSLPNENGEQRLKYFLDEQERLKRFMASTTLAEVTVKTRAKSKVEELDEKYTSGLFSGGDSYQFDVNDDVFALGKMDVFQYLQGRVAGLQINYNSNSGQPALTWRGGSPSLYLDEMPNTSPDMLMSVPMSDIAYIKVFRPPFIGSTGGGGNGAIVIYTKKGNDGKRIYSNTPGLSTSVLGGYSTYKEFYSPNYDTQKFDEGPDTRTTLYWNPFIITDKRNKTVQLEFYNNDISKKFKLVLEGMNSDGKLARVEKIIQ